MVGRGDDESVVGDDIELLRREPKQRQEGGAERVFGESQTGVDLGNLNRDLQLQSQLRQKTSNPIPATSSSLSSSTASTLAPAPAPAPATTLPAPTLPVSMSRDWIRNNRDAPSTGPGTGTNKDCSAPQSVGDPPDDTNHHRGNQAHHFDHFDHFDHWGHRDPSTAPPSRDWKRNQAQNGNGDHQVEADQLFQNSQTFQNIDGMVMNFPRQPLADAFHLFPPTGSHRNHSDDTAESEHDWAGPEPSSNLQPQLRQPGQPGQQPRQRPRQVSLASGWRFPSMHSSHPSIHLSPPQSPYSGHTSQTTPRLQQRAPDSGASDSGSPSSPSPRRRRDNHRQQNTDPLVYRRFISPDPVDNGTRTLPLSEHSPSEAQTQTTNPRAHGQPALSSSSLSFFPSHFQHRQFASVPPRGVPRTHHDQQDSFQRHANYRYGNIDADEALASQPPAEPRCNQPQPRVTLPLNGPLFDRQFLPATPDSPTGACPRWDSLLPDRDPKTLTQPLRTGLATTTNAPVILDSKFPPSPIRSPKSPAGAFPTNPYAHPFVPEDHTLGLAYDSTDTARYERAAPVTTSGQVGRMYRPDSQQSGDTACSADNYNFSRPRKISMKSLNRPDFSGSMSLRPGTAQSTASDSLRLESRTMISNTSYAPDLHYNPTPRKRPSVSSNMSSSTFASAVPGLRHHASHDHLGSHQTASHNAATGSFMGLPHALHPQAPPRYYNRGGPLAQSQQSHLYEDEMRASVRSHLTTSTAQETLFSEPERSSVMTKTSSVFSSSFRNTRQSSFFGPNTPTLEVRDSLSVDDVMGMYENGFNDSEMDLVRRMSGMDMDGAEAPVMRLAPGGMDDYDESRPGSAMSHNSAAANRLLEAMSQTDPMPIPGRSFPLNGDGPVVLRDTNAFFRKSLASSLPKDMRLSFISTRSKLDDQDLDDGDMHGTFETDSQRHSRHDSGKLVGPESEEDSPIEDPEKHDASLLIPNVSSLPHKDSLSPQVAMAEKAAPQTTPSPPVQGAPQPEDADPDANDRYGFRKSNQYITREQYDEWNGPYSEYLDRRRRKWESFLKDNGLMTDQPNRFPQHSAKAKRFVRKGIPPEWRGAAWFYYAGGPKILANNQGVYDNMRHRAESGGLKEVCRDDIERDLYRTFPDNIRFRRKPASPAPGQGLSSDPTPAHSRTNSTQSANPPPRAPGSEPEIIEALRRVLQAFAVFNPSIGYCQSLNFLGGMLLLFVESEEQAFWLLNIITRVYLPGTHEMSLEGSKVDLSVLMAELQDVLPNVWQKISEDGSAAVKKKSRRHRHHKGAPGASENLPPVTLALTAWFMSCYIGTLPIETTLRVWDVFFYEGSKTLFRVALAIFKAGENEIKSINDPMEVFAVVQSLPRKMLDSNNLMDLCFKRRSGLNHITSEAIDEQRAERKERLQVERKEAIMAQQANPGIQSAATIQIQRKQSDMLSVNSGDAVRRKHTLFGRRHKDRGMTEV